MKKIRHWTMNEIKRLEEMYNSGMNDSEIAAELGCTVDAVSGKRHNHGLVSNHRPPWSEDEETILISAICALADKTGRTPKAVVCKASVLMSEGAFDDV